MESLLYRPDLGRGIGYDGNPEVLLQGLHRVKSSPPATTAGYPNSLGVLVFEKLLLRKGINLAPGKTTDPGPGSDPLYG